MLSVITGVLSIKQSKQNEYAWTSGELGQYFVQRDDIIMLKFRS